MFRSQHAGVLRWMRERALILGIAGLLLGFAWIAQEVMEGEPIAFDRWLLLAFRQASDLSVPVGPLWLQEAARDITALGSTAVLGILLLVVTLYLFADGKRHAAWLVLAAVLGGTVLNSVLKVAFGRPRPDLVTPLAEVFTLSFPSGHAALSAVTYLTLGALLGQTQASRTLRIHFMTTAALLTFLIGVSRVYLGVHYPTDVLAGWCFGIAWALICWSAMRTLQRTGRVEPPER